MKTDANRLRIPLPRNWSLFVRSAMLRLISVAQRATACSRSWAVNSQVTRVRLKAENDRLRQRVAWLNEELRIKDSRMDRVDP